MALNPFQQSVRDLARSLGLRGEAERQVYNTPQFLELVEAMFPVNIPPGSQIVVRTPGYVEWIDAEGYRHSARRNLDGKSPDVGKVTASTDRPAILPQNQQTRDLLSQLTGGLQGVANQQLANAEALARGETPAALDPGIRQYLERISALSDQLSQPATLASLDPQTQAALDTITQNTLAQLGQQFQRQAGQQLANLYRNRINQSSIANNALGQLLQQQGLVTSQALSDAASRELATRQYLTNQNLSQLQAALGGLQNAANTQLSGFATQQTVSQGQLDTLGQLLRELTSQQTQRDISSGTIEQSQRELDVTRDLGQRRLDLDKYLGELQAAAANSQGTKQLIGSGIGAGAIIVGAL